MPCTKMTFAGSALFVAALTASASTQSSPPTMSAPAAKAMGAPTSVVPTGLGEAIDRDVTRLRRSARSSRTAPRAQGYPQETTACREPQAPWGTLRNKALKTTLDVEKPEGWSTRSVGDSSTERCRDFVRSGVTKATALYHGPEPEAR